ncbi:hypothetical protein D2E95_01900 [Mycobacteroides abscessus]|uniref:hypothetical protein n=1 Tax=Mycobacteroides abscessus TaxID=36809 RepID=UPI0009A7E177|nr:hypothetical protein [Mycobacteroides abscessus]RIT64099.1 hypothetical protein D2E95_01900 [Mycobacteroides abscessus]RIU49889.1 hypothetical protein D2F02_16215 [Mycobacteroides abscessus]SKN31285.1 Uncharacterised protein [Mycobacteroides abscessus subsp. abscessus]
MTSTEHVLQLVAAERQRQQDKWGEQNHPNIVSSGTYADAIRGESARFYGIPTAAEAKARTDERARRGEVTWMDILIEELAEAAEAADIYQMNREVFRLEDADSLRRAVVEELVQVAAVAVQWAEKLGGGE